MADRRAGDSSGRANFGRDAKTSLPAIDLTQEHDYESVDEDSNETILDLDKLTERGGARKRRRLRAPFLEPRAEREDESTEQEQNQCASAAPRKRTKSNGEQQLVDDAEIKAAAASRGALGGSSAVEASQIFQLPAIRRKPIQITHDPSQVFQLAYEPLPRISIPFTASTSRASAHAPSQVFALPLKPITPLYASINTQVTSAKTENTPEPSFAAGKISDTDVSDSIDTDPELTQTTLRGDDPSPPLEPQPSQIFEMPTPILALPLFSKQSDGREESAERKQVEENGSRSRS